MISIAMVMTLMGTHGPKEQESCLVEAKSFRHQSFLGKQGKNAFAMNVMLEGTSY
jgi:hypothetical protein